MSSSYQMPAEWAPHERCWMAWPLSERTFGAQLDAARNEYAAVAQAIAEFEPVTMLYDPDNCAGVRELAQVANITLMECPLNDSWLRDTGPTFVLDANGTLAGVDWAFDGWGTDWPTEKDAGIAKHVITLSGVQYVQSSMIFEGGALNIDDHATIVTTRQCFEHRTRNGGPTMSEVEAELSNRLGVSKVIWLNETLENDSTNGHVDVVAAFAPNGTVLCQVSSDLDDPDYDNLQANLKILKSETDAAGKPMNVVELISPPVSRHSDGSRRMLSYANFYVANGGVIVPQYGFPDADARAMKTIADVFPDHKVIGVMTNAIADGGGNIHCITQQQPKTGSHHA